QRRKQGGVVGAAASKTRVLPKARCGCWVPQPDSCAHSKSSHLPPQVKIASGGKKDYTIKNVCGAQAAGAEEMKHETTGLL
uniref:hypothetical protein n=1 Tax=Faecalibacterium prausnitzii TaxID=853 RepID=UPI0040386E85